MTGLTVADILDVVDRCQDLHHIDAALVLLEFAAPSLDADARPRLPIGDRDRLLLQLRSATFGADLELVTRCPACASPLEVHHAIADLLVDAPDDATRASLTELRVDVAAFRVAAADSYAMAAAVTAVSTGDARRAIAASCAQRIDGAAGDSREWPDAWLDAIGDRLAALDPQADLTFNLTCPQCEHEWEGVFDIAHVFRRELEVRGQRILHDVHELAERYHWSESEILALNPGRRRRYLELAHT